MFSFIDSILPQQLGFELEIPITQITPSGVHGNYLHNQLSCPHRMPGAESTFNCNVLPFAKELMASASLSFRYPSKDRNNEETHVLVAAF